MDVLTGAELVREEVLVQSERDRENRTDFQSGWGNVDSPPILMDYTDESGLSCDVPDDCSPLNMFNIMFDGEMWTVLTRETNTYAQNVIRLAREGNTVKPSVTVDFMTGWMSMKMR